MNRPLGWLFLIAFGLMSALLMRADSQFASLDWVNIRNKPTTVAGFGITDAITTITNDTNVTGSRSGNTLTLGWTGTLAKTRNLSTAVYTDQANTFSTGAQDFGSATSLKTPTSAGATPTASGLIAYDSTANAYKFGVNGATKTVFFADSSLACSQHPALTGDVTTSAGNCATTITNNAVTNAKAAQMAANTIKGNNTGSTANAADLTAAQAAAVIRTGQVDSIERTLPFYSSDFFNNTGTNPFTNSAIASGTNSTAPAAGTITTAHPGIALLRSSTSANSGYTYSIGLSQATAGQIRLGGGEQFDAVIWMPAALTNNTIRVGWHDCTTSADCVDGVYVEIPSTGAAVCKASSNSTRTTSSTIATLSTSTWYHIRVKINSTSSADCTIWNDAGSQQGTQNVASNIPSASGREVGAGIIGTNSGTTASDIVAVDYMSVAWTTALQRGK